MNLLPGRESDLSRKIPRLWHLVSVAVLLGASAYGTLLLNARTAEITTLWPCNGLLLGVLLAVPRRHWVYYLGVGLAVDLTVNAAIYGVNAQQVLLALCNTTEVLLALVALAWLLPHPPDLTRSGQLFKFLFFGVTLAPAVASLLACSVITALNSPDLLSLYSTWFEADALGIATMTPLYLSMTRRDSMVRRAWWEVSGLFLMIFVSTLLVFGQDKYPFLFVILPFLLLAGVRLGLAGASFGLIVVTVLGGYMTSLGHGPVALVPHASTGQHVLVFQFFIAISMLMLYGTEVLLRRNDTLQAAVAASEARFRLLTETSRDIILLSDLDGRRRYVSPAVTEVLGWTPEEMQARTYRETVHPDDVELVTRLLDDCRQGRTSQSDPYRCRKPDGSYVWVETTLQLYRQPDSSDPVGVVSVMRDISGRKAAEEELQAAYKTVEALATVDGLTGLANRRRLDDVLQLEWRRAMRDRTCISVLMFDVDQFKAYNDLYGHVRGDECLRQIAEAAVDVVSRPGDLIARFGGEEFAVVLPKTDAEGSREIAEEIRVAVERRALPHSGNAPRVITVSVGCATVVPFRGSDSGRLIEAADQALYRAKRAGRNQVCDAAPREEFGMDRQAKPVGSESAVEGSALRARSEAS